MKKSFRLLALILIILLSLSACKSSGGTTTSPTPTAAAETTAAPETAEPTPKETAPAETAEPAAPTADTSVDESASPEPAETQEPEPQPLSIAIVTSGSSVDDGSFNQDNYLGITDFASSRPYVTYQDFTSADISMSETDVKAIVADYDVIVLPGYQFGGAGLATLALENPEKKFILVDSYPADPADPTGSTYIEVSNIYAMQFVEQESGFFAGVAAALQTQTNKVAVVNGIAYPSNVNYEYGFYAGVNYVNKHYGKSVEYVELPQYSGTDVTGADVGGNYAGDFGAPDIGKSIADQLYSDGVDIIFAAAGATGNGVITSAKERTGVYVIGVDVDQWADGETGSGNIMITAGLKNMRINVTRQLEAIEAGTFVGGNFLLGADTDSTGYVSADGRQQLTAESLEILADLYAKVKAGEIVPPGNFTAATVTEFPGL